MVVEPRPAATVILLRDGPGGAVETWLMERSRAVGFMASAWVFPGGRVEEADATLPALGGGVSPARAFWLAAARELEEEAAVRLGSADAYDLDTMRPWSHWITPEVEPRRYDTWFFVARLPEGAAPRIDGQEAVDGAWFSPHAAIERAHAGRLAVAPPTLRTLLELAPFRTVADVLATERRTPPVCPRYGKDVDGNVFVLLPGDPEHPSAEAVDPPYRYVFQQGRWWAR